MTKIIGVMVIKMHYQNATIFRGDILIFKLGR